MNKIEMTEAIMTAKSKSGLGWEAIAEKVGLDPVFVTSACLGMNSLKSEYADKLCEALQLPGEVSAALLAFPNKKWDQVVPTDPVIYRWYEIVGVYGETIKEIIHEKFGDGIMSAIDFSMSIDKEENPAGDRVLVAMSGKFLPYKSW
ncbi:MAG: cyanase [Candidatus Thiodiazotropha endolucinida]|nr:cyanase [Candidatus Thiodiazotropha sp. (ex Lucina pensylvanica)]MCG7874975.1 cyanase [Candidatus Thiodiazotropha taylori]MCG8022511.1 cyanase [Candidatus Thiodiazotropha endolucinida]MCG7881294.1 cyanase [Candidatus Thiodiazotropha taylori]MCG7887534.1 cyanase [Candidatus Thiodiazotropha taylori]